MSPRVLQIVPELGFGGAEQMVLNLANGLRERGNEVTVVVLGALPAGSPGVLADFLAGGGNVIACDKPPGISLRTIAAVRRAIRKGRPDVVHSHQHGLRYLLAATMGSPGATGFVHTLHTPQAAQAGIVADLVHAWARRRRVRPVAVAPAIAAAYEESYGYRGIATVPNGVDMCRFAPDAAAGAAWRAERGIPADDIVIACVARLQPVKNHELLLRAFRQVLDDFANARLVLIGDGPLLSELRETTRALGLTPRVEFAGTCVDVERALQGADIAALSSKWEAHPLSLVEAMAVGLPVIAPSVGGIVDVVVDGENGLLFAAGDCAALAAGLSALCRDAGLRRRMGVAARAEVAAQCSIAAMVEGYLGIYAGLGAERRERATGRAKPGDDGNRP